MNCNFVTKHHFEHLKGTVEENPVQQQLGDPVFPHRKQDFTASHSIVQFPSS